MIGGVAQPDRAHGSYPFGRRFESVLRHHKEGGNMLNELNKKASRLSYVDIKFLEVALLTLGVILTKLFPKVLEISFPVLIAAAILFSIKPFYSFWLKK